LGASSFGTAGATALVAVSGGGVDF
jgi:hypothetical protein